MSAPTRFPSGVTNVASTDPMGMFGMPDPTLYHTFFDDFDDWDASRWVVTEIDSDGDAAVAVGVLSADGGILRVPCEADELDSTFIQWQGEEASAVYESFLFETGKEVWFKARFRISDATDTGIVIGLHIVDTDPAGGVTDGVFFRKPDTDATMSLVIEKDSTETTVEAGEVEDATWHTIAFYYDGKNAFKAFFDDVHAGTGVADNLPDNEELAMSFGLINGAEGVENLDMDYVFAAKAR